MCLGYVTQFESIFNHLLVWLWLDSETNLQRQIEFAKFSHVQLLQKELKPKRALLRSLLFLTKWISRSEMIVSLFGDYLNRRYSYGSPRISDIFLKENLFNIIMTGYPLDLHLILSNASKLVINLLDLDINNCNFLHDALPRWKVPTKVVPSFVWDTIMFHILMGPFWERQSYSAIDSLNLLLTARCYFAAEFSIEPTHYRHNSDLLSKRSLTNIDQHNDVYCVRLRWMPKYGASFLRAGERRRNDKLDQKAFIC